MFEVFVPRKITKGTQYSTQQKFDEKFPAVASICLFTKI